MPWVWDIFCNHPSWTIPPNNLYVWVKKKCTKESNQATALLERETVLTFVGLSGFQVPSGAPEFRGLLNICFFFLLILISNTFKGPYYSNQL